MERGSIERFLERHMRKGGRYVPARIQAALALLERLRDHAELRLEAHKKPNSSGLDSHETYGAQVHQRLALEPINTTHGRRSSDIGGWGQDLLDLVRGAGFESFGEEERDGIVNELQQALAAPLRAILEQEPPQARLKARTAEAVITDLLKQAEAKSRSGEVAQYLVGAKLQLRLDREIAVRGYNRGDRRHRSDPNSATGDFEVENTTIEVAVGPPDEKHLTQIAEALRDTDLELWLLTRHDRVPAWRTEVENFGEIDLRRVVVASVESFIGQNISELGGFSSGGKTSRLTELFRLYNDRWVARVGSPGIRIVCL